MVNKDLGMVTAYAYAVSKGYTGTEDEFAALMADYADVGQAAVDAALAAKASEDAAKTSETAAEASETAAATSAGTATTAAQTASQAAQIATTKASEATTAASTATGKAAEASQSATGAAASATTAESAKTAAQAAQTAAETAQTAAEDAQAAAEDAAESVEGKAAQIDQNTEDISLLKTAIDEFGVIDGSFVSQTITQVTGKYAYYTTSSDYTKYNGRIDSSSSSAYAQLAVSPNDILLISTRGTANRTPCVFYSSNEVGTSTFLSALDLPASTTTYTDYKVVIPAGCACVIVNTANYTEYPIAVKKFVASETVSSLYDAMAFFNNKYEHKAKEIHVATDGSGDFTNLRAALDSITDNSADNPYNIIIHKGTYNVLSDYTQEEIEDDGFIGPLVSDGISLIGYDGAANVILNGELSTSTYNRTKRNAVSTLNMAGQYCRIEGITVKGKNIRYAVHDDLATSYRPIYMRIYKNCVFIGDSLTSGGSLGNIAFGAGTNGRKQMYFDNCTFEDVVLIHTSNGNTQSSFTQMNNCKAKAFKVSDYNSAMPMVYELNNCSYEILECEQSGTTHDQYVRINGVGGEIRFFDSIAGYVANLTNCVRYQGTQLAAGYAVKVNNNFTPSVATTRADVIGISVGYIDGDSFVQSDGFISSNTLGLSNVSVGDYIGIDENGQVVKIDDASGAVGVVKYSFGLHGNKFIKLMI